MKKFACILLTLCLLLCLRIGAAAAQYANMFALLLDWEANGYPEDVGGVYTTDGTSENFTVLLVDDDDHSRENALRAMLEDDSTASFAPCQYSISQLQAISTEIQDARMSSDKDIYSCTLDWGSEGGFGASGRELRVIVTVPEARVAEYASQLSEKYGDAVVVEAGAPAQTDAAPAEAGADAAEHSDDVAAPAANEAAQEADSPALWWIVLAVAVVAVAAVLFVLLRRKAKKAEK